MFRSDSVAGMRIGFVGLGRMGVGMAGRLVAAGHDVAVFNRTPERAEPLRSLGARVVGSAREAAQGADAVVCTTTVPARRWRAWRARPAGP